MRATPSSITLLACAFLVPAYPIIPAVAQDTQAAAPDATPDATPNAAPHAHRLRDRFAAANTTGDGHLTKAQAEAANFLSVSRNFDAIDTGHRGFVTLRDIRAFRRAHRAAPTPDAPQ